MIDRKLSIKFVLKAFASFRYFWPILQIRQLSFAILTIIQYFFPFLKNHIQHFYIILEVYKAGYFIAINKLFYEKKRHKILTLWQQFREKTNLTICKICQQK